MSVAAIERFLASTDLDDLAAAYDELAARPDGSGRATATIEAWSDVQAVSNLLMHPSLLPDALRTTAVLRALREDGYVRLAATVGAGELSAGELSDEDRRELLGALLDVVASDVGPAAVRAAAEVGPLLSAAELELLDDLAAHPVDAVRHNLAQAALGITDPDAQQPVLLPYLPNLADVTG